LPADIIAAGSKHSCQNLDNGLDGVEEEAKDEDAGVSDENGIADPAFGAIRHSKRGDKGHHQKDRNEAKRREERVVGVHGRRRVERPEGVECQDLYHLADGE
jgi:hypothetical protein